MVKPAASWGSTLVMVGFVIAPLEINALGRKLTFHRPALALTLAAVIATCLAMEKLLREKADKTASKSTEKSWEPTPPG